MNTYDKIAWSFFAAGLFFLLVGIVAHGPWLLLAMVCFLCFVLTPQRWP